jgi:3-methyl-2-oxobutanoate hydroxymethyltransferase
VARRMTLMDIARKVRAGDRLVMVTAYDYPSARIAEDAGVDIILVGDSVGTTVFGEPDTLTVTMDDMVRHAGIVARATTRPLVVADLPFLSYQVSVDDALRNAGRLMQEARVQAVKLEGGRRAVPVVERLVESGIPVMGHLGFTPQSVHQLGGYRVQGRGETARQALREDALALQAAGVFAIVFEMVPGPLATALTAELTVPTIGIGAGPGTTGQVLVFHDVVGLTMGRQPRFAPRFGEAAAEMRRAVEKYAEAVRTGAFPAAEHTFDAEAEGAPTDADVYNRPHQGD